MHLERPQLKFRSWMHRLWRQCLEALWSLVAFMAVLAYTAILLWTPVPKRRGKNQA